MDRIDAAQHRRVDRRTFLKGTLIGGALAGAGLAIGAAADPDGGALYQARCSACHDNNSAEERAPKREQIATRRPEAILGAMFDGAMIAQASGLNLDEGRAIARFITGKEFSVVSDVSLGKCEAPPNGWPNGQET